MAETNVPDIPVACTKTSSAVILKGWSWHDVNRNEVANISIAVKGKEFIIMFTGPALYGVHRAWFDDDGTAHVH